MIAEVEFHSDKMMASVENSFLNATELADYLVLKGLPFREAHHLTGEIVKYCIKNSIYLLDLGLDIYKSYSPLMGDDVYNYLKFDVAIKNKKSPGSTSYDEVSKDTKALKAWVSTL
jgi:argininosuccinate lyase